jgi:hypothetical protein
VKVAFQIQFGEDLLVNLVHQLSHVWESGAVADGHAIESSVGMPLKWQFSINN